jgi:hypothetical protein
MQCVKFVVHVNPELLYFASATINTDNQCVDIRISPSFSDRVFLYHWSSTNHYFS